ncbi:cellulose biosynthesis protein BcsS [Nitratireductor arenosus]|uniref:cellulose biosynthesis protein BcsS n=1 Tax=Nitratireductor arenosus TaxID=2682096 RepID=UPI0018D23855
MEQALAIRAAGQDDNRQVFPAGVGSGARHEVPNCRDRIAYVPVFGETVAEQSGLFRKTGIHGPGGSMKIFAEAKPIIGLSSGLVAAILLSATSYAADTTPDDRMADTPVFDTVIYWGADLGLSRSGKDGYGIDAGFVTALNGDIATSGWTLTSGLGFSRTDDVLSDSKSFYGSLLLGYQWHAPGYYFTVAGGANYVRNDETPPGSVTDGDELGAIVQYGFETKRVNALYVQSYGSFSTAHNQIYGHAKVGYKTPVLRFGPEFTVFDDEGSQATLRYGAFVGDIPVFGSLSMVVSAGYQDELEPGQSDGFYATIGFSVPLSIR